jgi:hypothetical protein
MITIILLIVAYYAIKQYAAEQREYQASRKQYFMDLERAVEAKIEASKAQRKKQHPRRRTRRLTTCPPA